MPLDQHGPKIVCLDSIYKVTANFVIYPKPTWAAVNDLHRQPSQMGIRLIH